MRTLAGRGAGSTLLARLAACGALVTIGCALALSRVSTMYMYWNVLEGGLAGIRSSGRSSGRSRGGDGKGAGGRGGEGAPVKSQEAALEAEEQADGPEALQRVHAQQLQQGRGREAKGGFKVGLTGGQGEGR